MLKIKKDISVKISLVLAYVALVGIAAACIALPFILRHMLSSVNTVYMKRFVPSLIVLYSAVVPVSVADIMLIRLLGLVRESQVFTASAVAILRGISWCCFAECAILLLESVILFGLTTPIICAVAFVAAFLGIVLRVVKNVIEEATAIKSENDFTI
ncbi:MAG: DUF2975 domain-containing protein [Clostridia bacterium]|nr:DUF2975 domain-containing protein [Clostridia bacterium]